MLRLSPDTKKYEFVQPTCHSRLNRFGQMSLSNRYQIVSRHSSSKANKTIDIQKSGRYGLSYTGDSRQALTKRSTSPQVNQESPESDDRISKIRKLGLLGGLQLKHIRYQGHIRMPTVHNDYHQATSNPGYSRKPDGGIYPK